MANRNERHFVGRSAQLAELEKLLQEAERGRGAAAALYGEAGVGKTRTAQVFAERARARGARALWGNCYAEWTPALGPWIQVLEPAVAALDPSELRSVLGTKAAALADLLPKFGDMEVGDAPEMRLHPEEAQFRTYEALVELLRWQATPLVVVLDDVHLADRSSLGLLRYVGRQLPDLRVALVVTYRDDEVALTHPLAQALAEIGRSAPLHQLPLSRLDGDEVHELVTKLADASVSRGLTEAIHRDTGGNPFFVSELVRSLAQEHDLGTIDVVSMPVPQSVRQAIGRRLAAASEDTYRLLALAAAFDGPFGLPELHAVTGVDEHRVSASIDEAVRMHLIRAVAGERYEFVHALARQAVYAETSPGRRARLHRRVAEALERIYGSDRDERAGEIAIQYAKSAMLPGAAHGTRFARAAAEQARRRDAYDEAAAFLRIARDLSSASRPSVRAEILRTLALAEADALELEAAEATIEDALAELEHAGADADAAAAFLADVTTALKIAGASEQVLAPLVRRGLAFVGEHRNLAWARLRLVLNPVQRRSRGGLHYARWLGLDEEVVEIARREGTEADYARTLMAFDLRENEIEPLLERVRGWRNGSAKIEALYVVAVALLYNQGRIRAAQALADELLAVSVHSGSIFGQAHATLLLAEIAADLGEFEQARSHLRDARRLLGHLGPEHRLRRATSNAEEFLLEYVGGDWRPLAERYARLAGDPAFAWPWLGPLAAAESALGFARLGERAQATRLLRISVPVLNELGGRHPTWPAAVDAAVAAAWELDVREWAADLGPLVRAWPVDQGRDGSRDLAGARTAALAGKLEEARVHFDRARNTLESIEHRPLRAIVDYDEALMLQRAGQHGAEPLLAAAGAQFGALGMRCWSERADELAKLLGADRTYPGGLTAREAEILALLAGGARNKEIAAQLHVSVHTVERHLANIYTKIEARNRSEATAYALAAGL